jgi:hypothetical protein
MSIFEIAFHLKMSVAQLKLMPYDELLGWMNYFERRPIGWRDDDRTFKLLQVQGCKEKPERVFSSLGAIKHAEQEARKMPNGMISMSNLKNSALFQKIMQAEGGERIPL